MTSNDQSQQWVIALQTVVELPNGSKHLGYTVLDSLPLFETLEATIAAIKEAELPLGWVAIQVKQFLPNLELVDRTASNEGDTVAIPQNADQAALMVLLGTKWLQEYAPERLSPPAQVNGHDTKTWHHVVYDDFTYSFPKDWTIDAITEQMKALTEWPKEFNVSNTMAGFRGGFIGVYGHAPSEQQIWNAGVRSGYERTIDKPAQMEQLRFAINSLERIADGREKDPKAHAKIAVDHVTCNRSFMPPPSELTKLGWELDGAIKDIETNGLDIVCLDTIKRVRNSIAAMVEEPGGVQNEANEAAKEALQSLRKLEQHLQQTDAPADVRDLTIDVRCSIGSLLYTINTSSKT